MPKAILRTARLNWKTPEGAGGAVDVFVPALLSNLRMVDRRLKKAGLRELEDLMFPDDGRPVPRRDAAVAFEAALDFFDRRPESIPFSDILVPTLGGMVEALAGIPEDAEIQFSRVDIGHAGLDHGSVIAPPAG
ncbi:hypothetical protein [Alienimonas californiensis]|uniref:Uncharacterized protein n=1 Tax=Alienimonas californiensis TaxID=2527989 RepID=A0A517P608_9PLAN|nr:hypothetical protein [Alienimonas californiensis]QDT14807.1 hypothetical protein CA12_08860 [Alienimonas californiensis]